MVCFRNEVVSSLAASMKTGLFVRDMALPGLDSSSPWLNSSSLCSVRMGGTYTAAATRAPFPGAEGICGLPSSTRQHWKAASRWHSFLPRIPSTFPFLLGWKLAAPPVCLLVAYINIHPPPQIKITRWRGWRLSSLSSPLLE